MKSKNLKIAPLRAFKKLSYGKTKSAGRNYSGSITVYHRGGGSKRNHRRIDFQRNLLYKGIVERIEYDPNRSSKIALIRWDTFSPNPSDFFIQPGSWEGFGPRVLIGNKHRNKKGGINQALNKVGAFFSYILACDGLKPGDPVLNLHLNLNQNDYLTNSSASLNLSLKQGATPYSKRDEINSEHLITEALSKKEIILRDSLQIENITDRRLYQETGNNSILAKLPVGSIIHNIEIYPGQGGKLVRAAGTFAQLVQKFENLNQSMIRLPSGRKLLLNSQCRATIGIVSNVTHNTRKLRKAGQSRWLGRLPVVRGVAMNPIDHPHGGGEGRTKGGRPSVSPWGKPAKGPRRQNRKSTNVSQSLSLVFGLSR